MPFREAMEKLKAEQEWTSLTQAADLLAQDGRMASILIVCLCVAQLSLCPGEWTNISKQVQEAYKLADALKLKREHIPDLVRAAMEEMKLSGKKSAAPPAGEASADDAATQLVPVDDEEPEEMDGQEAVAPKRRGRGGGAKGSGRAPKPKPKAAKAAAVRRSNKRSA